MSKTHRSQELVKPSSRGLGYVGLGWALSYLPIHVYWAVGGLTSSIGITGAQPAWRAANWGACVVIVGAGLTCLSLEQPWGRILPHAVRYGTAWVGGLFGIAHWVLYTSFCSLRLAGVVGYPSGHPTAAQLRRFDWANLAYFELWFGVMGVLLIVCAQRSRRRERLSERRPISAWRRVGTVFTLAGLATVVWGVFTFDAWLFAGYGPAALGAGLLILLNTDQERTNNEGPHLGVPRRGLGHRLRRPARVLGDRSH